jgi:hypothetical protein
MFAILGLIFIGCQGGENFSTSGNSLNSLNRATVYTETLGVPDIDITEGSGLAVAGTGMLTQPASIEIEVPSGDIKQVLLYWSGGTNVEPLEGDNTIVFEGMEIEGALVGGPAFFFDDYDFYTYRADITEMELVSTGTNTYSVDGMEFAFEGDNQNSGVALVVIYDDGSEADIQLREGLDLAYYDFPEPRNAVVPQIFTFLPSLMPRPARVFLAAGSADEGSANKAIVTVGDAVYEFDDVFGSEEGPRWDTEMIVVTVPAGVTSLTVEVMSMDSEDPSGAYLSWVMAAMSIPLTQVVQVASVGDFVWYDMNMDGIQDEGEPGIEGVTVNLYDCEDNFITSTMTDSEGMYMFSDLMPGDYYVMFELPDDHVFTMMDQGMDDTMDSDADPETGKTVCFTLEAGDVIETWDAGLYMEEVDDGCTRSKGYWKNHAGFGPQDDVVSQYLPIWLGNDDGDMSFAVTDAKIAVDILHQHTYGEPSNGITKLYAQLLAAKLNIAAGANDDAIEEVITDADDFLTMYDWEDWYDLGWEDREMVLYWKDMLDSYNNGHIGPGYCDDYDDDDMDDDDDDDDDDNDDPDNGFEYTKK